jgi:hypothetical protein
MYKHLNVYYYYYIANILQLPFNDLQSQIANHKSQSQITTISHVSNTKFRWIR